MHKEIIACRQIIEQLKGSISEWKETLSNTKNDPKFCENIIGIIHLKRLRIAVQLRIIASYTCPSILDAAFGPLINFYNLYKS